jgi:hypothetical protein
VIPRENLDWVPLHDPQVSKAIPGPPIIGLHLPGKEKAQGLKAQTFVAHKRPD